MSCTLGIKHKSHQIPSATLPEMFIPSMLSKLVWVDFFGVLSNGFHVLTFLDRFSKHNEPFSIKFTSPEDVVDALINYMTKFGLP